jgi:hypothetical protein
MDVRRGWPFLALLGPLAGCGQPASEEECRAAIAHALEVQIEAAQLPPVIAELSRTSRAAPTADEMRDGKRWLRNAIPGLVTPEIVAQCTERMTRRDALCTVDARTPEELVDKCHWKPVNGPKGAALGF